jgi:hypothetical protein
LLSPIEPEELYFAGVKDGDVIEVTSSASITLNKGRTTLFDVACKCLRLKPSCVDTWSYLMEKIGTIATNNYLKLAWVIEVALNEAWISCGFNTSQSIIGPSILHPSISPVSDIATIHPVHHKEQI